MPLTDITQVQYRREGLRYASDFTDAESKFAKPIVLLRHQNRTRETNLRAPDFSPYALMVGVGTIVGKDVD
jgi:hypothetical protein